MGPSSWLFIVITPWYQEMLVLCHEQWIWGGGQHLCVFTTLCVFSLWWFADHTPTLCMLLLQDCCSKVYLDYRKRSPGFSWNPVVVTALLPKSFQFNSSVKPQVPQLGGLCIVLLVSLPLYSKAPTGNISLLICSCCEPFQISQFVLCPLWPVMIISTLRVPCREVKEIQFQPSRSFFNLLGQHWFIEVKYCLSLGIW